MKITVQADNYIVSQGILEPLNLVTIICEVFFFLIIIFTVYKCRDDYCHLETPNPPPLPSSSPPW